MRMAGCLLLAALAACSSGGSGGSGNPIAPGPPPGPNPAPQVTLSGGPSVDADRPLTLTVQATDDDGISEILIDWGDGTGDRLDVGGASSHQATLNHDYGRVGAFKVEATATDTRQARGSAFLSVTTRGGDLEIGFGHAPGSAPLIARATVMTGSRETSLLDGGFGIVADLVPGEYHVSASAAHPDCAIEGESTRTVRIEADARTRIDLSIRCTFVPEERIAYNTQAPEGFDDAIYSVRPDGSDRRLLADRNGPAFPNGMGFPAWSPDGTKILAGSGTLWMMNYDGTEPTRVGPGGRPAWSPDGEKVAYELDGDLVVADVAGRTLTNLMPLTQDGFGIVDEGPSWSPDGSTIVFHRGDVVHRIGIDGSDLRALVAGLAAVWIPDGSRIVFAHRGESQQIASIRPDGADLRILTALERAGHPDPSPQGDRIVFHSPNAEGAPRLWIMNADGTNPRVIEAVPAPAGHANWGPP